MVVLKAGRVRAEVLPPDPTLNTQAQGLSFRFQTERPAAEDATGEVIISLLANK
jgi:hypothetical protein